MTIIEGPIYEWRCMDCGLAGDTLRPAVQCPDCGADCYTFDPDADDQDDDQETATP